jgi:hypothetical protein
MIARAGPGLAVTIERPCWDGSVAGSQSRTVEQRSTRSSSQPRWSDWRDVTPWENTHQLTADVDKTAFGGIWFFNDQK